MLPETIYRVTETGYYGPYYTIERDGEVAYEVTGLTGQATFETPDGTVAFRAKTWGLEDERYGYVVRDGDGEDLGWIADEVPFVGRKLAIKNMDDETLATLGDSGLVGKAMYELFSMFDSPIPAQSKLVFTTTEGHVFGRVERTVGAHTTTVGLEDVGLDERLALAALIILTTGDKSNRELSYDRLMSDRRQKSRDD